MLKRSMNPGFAGIENALFYNPKCARHSSATQKARWRNSVQAVKVA